MKKIILMIVMIMMCSSVVMATPSDSKVNDTSLGRAEKLKTLGIFKGSDGDFELEREPKRIEGLIMFLRMMGNEKVSMRYDGVQPFTDLEPWMKGYVSWAYEHGYTKGVGPTEFGKGNISAKSYMTLMLRALGYDDLAGDFTWHSSLNFAKELGIINEEDLGIYENEVFTREHLSQISYQVLKAKMKSGQGLSQTLVDQGTMNENFSMKYGLIESDGRRFVAVNAKKTNEKNGEFEARFKLSDVDESYNASNVHLYSQSSNSWKKPMSKELVYKMKQIDQSFINKVLGNKSNNIVGDYYVRKGGYGYDKANSLRYFITSKGLEAIMVLPPVDYDQTYYAAVYDFSQEDYDQYAVPFYKGVDEAFEKVVKLEPAMFRKDNSIVKVDGSNKYSDVYYVYPKEEQLLSDLGVAYVGCMGVGGSTSEVAADTEFIKDELTDELLMPSEHSRLNSYNVWKHKQGTRLNTFYDQDGKMVAYMAGDNYQNENALKRVKMRVENVDRDDFDSEKITLIFKKDGKELFRMKDQTLIDTFGEKWQSPSEQYYQDGDDVVYFSAPIRMDGIEVSVISDYAVQNMNVVDDMKL